MCAKTVRVCTRLPKGVGMLIAFSRSTLKGRFSSCARESSSRVPIGPCGFMPTLRVGVNLIAPSHVSKADFRFGGGGYHEPSERSEEGFMVTPSDLGPADSSRQLAKRSLASFPRSDRRSNTQRVGDSAYSPRSEAPKGYGNGQ